jgi:CheY-like chemotaxis protein
MVVLVVGPPGASRDWTERVLEEAGFDASAFTLGGLLSARKLPASPRLVVLDHHGDRADRLASQRKLRADPRLRTVPLLILALQADIDSFSEAISVGASAYLVKPVSVPDLVAAAERLCGWGKHPPQAKRRRPLLMKVGLGLGDESADLEGQMLDVSPGGCRVELGQALPEGVPVRVVLHAPQGSTEVALGGEVRWHKLTEAGMHLVGLRFNSLSALMVGRLLGLPASA